MNANSMSENLQKAQQERQQAQADENRKILETLKNDFRNCLISESKDFKNSIAQAQTRLRRLLWAVLMTMTLFIMLTSYLILSIHQSARKLNDQAQLFLESRHASDVLGELNLVPVGDLVKSPDGRTLIEVKPLKE